ncbi:hypothetical protein GCM10009661_17790 [Catellatospora chokoriensis]|uniref:Uncharacterized protein n=1 Tax=Catellatospora chokoriensis TaxID=310353 RepID=A0A8J3NN34_9ACTN|nr:hypothetical protein Cch02nite_00190 [Catellatospora chokoriensis]
MPVAGYQTVVGRARSPRENFSVRTPTASALFGADRTTGDADGRTLALGDGAADGAAAVAPEAAAVPLGWANTGVSGAGEEHAATLATRHRASRRRGARRSGTPPTLPAWAVRRWPPIRMPSGPESPWRPGGGS